MRQIESEIIFAPKEKSSTLREFTKSDRPRFGVLPLEIELRKRVRLLLPEFRLILHGLLKWSTETYPHSFMKGILVFRRMSSLLPLRQFSFLGGIYLCALTMAINYSLISCYAEQWACNKILGLFIIK